MVASGVSSLTTGTSDVGEGVAVCVGLSTPASGWSWVVDSEGFGRPLGEAPPWSAELLFCLTTRRAGGASPLLVSCVPGRFSRGGINPVPGRLEQHNARRASEGRGRRKMGSFGGDNRRRIVVAWRRRGGVGRRLGEVACPDVSTLDCQASASKACCTIAHSTWLPSALKTQMPSLAQCTMIANCPLMLLIVVYAACSIVPNFVSLQDPGHASQAGERATSLLGLVEFRVS